MLAKIKSYMRQSKAKGAATVGGLFLILLLVFYSLSYLASVHAAQIFNHIMEKQKLLDGHIQVETLSANFLGRVSFTNLQWRDDTGSNVVSIPEGEFWVKPWDVVFRQLSTASITKASFKDAEMMLVFDDKMHIKGMKILEETPVQRSKDRRRKNFDIKLKNMDLRLKLDNCRVTALYQQRTFELNKVNADLHYDSDDKLAVDVSLGEFGGTLVGDGLVLRGSVDLKPEISTCNLNLTVKSLDPSSLGTGLNIHEKVNAVAKVTGLLPDPDLKGQLAMEALNLPGLKFTKVTGDYIYDDGLISASNVQARIFGGTCEATGSFNIDTKAYEVNCLGHKLQGGVAANTPLLSCEVELDLKMRCNGDNKSTQTFGSFTSGKGRYAVIGFDSIKGSFHNQFKTLTFTDVVISTPLGEVMSPSFKLIKGKLHMGEIYVGNKNTGQKVRLHI